MNCKVRRCSLFMGMMVAVCALLLAAGCVRQSAQSPVAPISAGGSSAAGQQAAVESHFVGNDACKGCHPHEFESHSATRHAHTLHDMTKAAQEGLAPPVGAIPGEAYHMQRAGNGYVMTSPKGEPQTLTLSYALGSGKTGVTYISAQSGDTLIQLPKSYFPHTRQWHETPGQEKAAPNAPGQVVQGATARKCLLCHATTLPDNALKPEPRFFGVGCESCHGPGSAHVATMQQAHPADTRMEKIGSWSATRINELCGRCHRTAQSIDALGFESMQTMRFQPYGLMESRCFKESGGNLSCLTCHDPHTDASKDARAYEAACLKCHGSNAAAPAANTAHAGKTCPVNPRTGCIPCHMPPRQLFPMSDVPTKMADHLILAYRDKHN